jgi:hypothetical protein
MKRILPATLATVVIVTATTLAATKFTSTWKAPEAAGTSFAGKKVAALVISNDENLRMSGEEALSRELDARGVSTVAAYRMVPREELRDPAKARVWFERASVAGVVAMRVVSAGKEKTYVPGVWSTPYYSSLWGYYGYGWGTVYDPGYVREDMVVVIETLIFSVPLDKLLWAGVSESTNPKNTAKLLEDLVDTAIEEMQKQKLIQQGQLSKKK